MVIYLWRASSRASQCRRTFIPLLVSLWNDLADNVFDGVGLARVLSAGPILIYWPKLFAPFLSSTVFSFSSIGWCAGRGIPTDRM